MGNKSYFTRCIGGLLLVSSFMICACTPSVTKQTSSIAWQQLIIKSEGFLTIVIGNDSDSSTVYVHHGGSFFAPVKKVTTDTMKVFFTKNEKDSLALLSHNLIVDPAKTKGMCTEYVGYLKLELQNGQVTQTGEYVSVCDWTKLSDTTRRLNNILNKRIKW